MENKNADPILTGFLCQSPQRKLEREKGEEVKEGKKEGTRETEEMRGERKDGKVAGLERRGR